MAQDTPPSPTPASLVLGGGVGLGAFQAGVFEVLAATPEIDIRSISGASIGALNGAIIVGNAPQDRITKLRAFWDMVAVEAAPSPWFDPWGLGDGTSFRLARNWINAVTTGLVGSPGLFGPRAVLGGRGESRSLYDNGVVADTLRSVIDFDRLNNGAIRFCVAATDVEAGEPVFFDTAEQHRIGPEHLIASSSLLPAFEPIRVGDRLLGDGGLACNLPLEAEIGPNRTSPPEPLCLAIDLFTPEGTQPFHLNRTVERSLDLMFGMQTRMRLAGLQREWALDAALAQAKQGTASPGADLLYVSYRSGATEAGFGKPFDLSRATLADRWEAGQGAATRALATWHGLGPDRAPGLRVHKVD